MFCNFAYMKQTSAHRLNWTQIQTQYPDAWVLLMNPVVPATGYAVTDAEVVYKNKRQKKVVEKAQELPVGSRFAIKYTGAPTLSADTVICL